MKNLDQLQQKLLLLVSQLLYLQYVQHHSKLHISGVVTVETPLNLTPRGCVDIHSLFYRLVVDAAPFPSVFL